MNLNGLHREPITCNRPIYGSSRLGIMNKAVKSPKSAVCSLPSFYPSLTNYYPFGYPISFRTHSTGYQYGFNGQEGDNEIYGDKLNYAFQYRMYDARIGRFWSVDPLRSDYPWNSTYAFAENSPIWAIDLDGMEKYIIITKYSVDRISPEITKVNYKNVEDYGPLGNGTYSVTMFLDGTFTEQSVPDERNSIATFITSNISQKRWIGQGKFVG